MKLYLSGPITGVVDYKENFARCAGLLRERGFEVVNPAEYPDGLEYEQYMALAFQDIPMMDGLAMMSGWENSSGAIREVDKALYLDLQVRKVEFWLTEGV